MMHAVTHLGYEAEFARSPKELEMAKYIILPGVGSAKATMESLGEMKILDALENAVMRRETYFLGICVGMQILFEHSEEEDATCLGWLKGKVVKFDSSKVRVPQMGWNYVEFINETSVPAVENNYFYFVNSYYAKPEEKQDIWATADYHGPFAAAICRKNIFATQFHVEKSGEAGLSLLKTFLSRSLGDFCPTLPER